MALFEKKIILFMATTLTEINSLGDNNTLIGEKLYRSDRRVSNLLGPRGSVISPLPQSSTALEEAGFQA